MITSNGIEYKKITTEYLSDYIHFYETMDRNTRNLFYPWRLASRPVLYRLLKRVDDGLDIRIGAFENGKIIGQVFVSTIYRIGLFGIAVISGYQGAGVGTDLMKRCSDEEKEMGLKYIYLSAFDSNLKAINMYEKYGYVKINRPNFFIKRLFTLYGWRNLGFLLALKYHFRVLNTKKYDSSSCGYIYMSRKCNG